MNLKILAPTAVVIEETAERIAAEGERGSFGLLPHHIDFVVPLVPGILSFVSPEGAETFVAVDRGILVKQGAEVWVSTRRAVCDRNLDTLQDTIEQEFLRLEDREKQARSAAAKLEAGFVRGLIQRGGEGRAAR